MKVNLNKEQLDFLSKQFDICQKDIENMSHKEWNAIREKCFEIEVDEMLTYGENCNTKLCNLVSSIIDHRIY